MQSLAAVATVLFMPTSASHNVLATKVVRFEDAKGRILYGQPSGQDKALPLDGNDPFESLRLSDAEVDVVKLLAPVPRPQAIYATGRNYLDHIKARNATPPKTPSLFFKNIFSYNHPNHPVIIQAGQKLPDYEGELAVVIGRDCKDVSEENALDCVLGYTICNDVSERCLQTENDETGCLGNGGQFSFSKGFDTHAPLGPALVPTEVLGDASGLLLQTRVNGELRQNASTSDMIFGVKQQVSFFSQGTTLPWGSVICTGTPLGEGVTWDPPTFLQDGDVVDISIEGIGTLSNPIVRRSSTVLV
jgi:2-keto-4-pentenoate hydratase/2-oxohepta-3-ene-1,7-dioic acid hydratase in catechol pathway